MVFNILFSKKSLLEIDEIIFWYESKQKNLGETFYLDYLINIGYITKNPYLFQLKFDTFREVPLKKFPYVIVFEIIERTIIINSVFHTSKNPKFKI